METAEGTVLVQRGLRQTLGQQVLSELQQYIVAHQLRPGDRLPTERELAAQLGVGCSTVREALKSLETIGALARHPKRGTVLQPVDFAHLAGLVQFQMLSSPADLTSLFIARRLLEVSVLPLVGRSVTEEHFRQMEAANEWMEADIDAGGFGYDGDIAFHQTVLAAANNHFLSQFGALIQEFFRQPRLRALSEEQESRLSLEHHHQIVAALRQGDVAGAQRIMELHLDHFAARAGIILPAASDPLPVSSGAVPPKNLWEGAHEGR